MADAVQLGNGVFVTDCNHNDEEQLFIYVAISLVALAIYTAKAYNII